MSPGCSAFEVIHFLHLMGQMLCFKVMSWDEQNFTSVRAYYNQKPGLITSPVQTVVHSNISYPIPFINWSVQPIYAMVILQEMSKHSEHMCLNIRVCVCAPGLNWRGVGESNLSHWGVETDGQICSRPRITPPVSMNEMTGLQGY